MFQDILLKNWSQIWWIWPLTSPSSWTSLSQGYWWFYADQTSDWKIGVRFWKKLDLFIPNVPYDTKWIIAAERIQHKRVKCVNPTKLQSKNNGISNWKGGTYLPRVILCQVQFMVRQPNFLKYIPNHILFMEE